MKIDSVPLFSRLQQCQRILIAGAGGGYDVFSGLPLYFRLKELGRDVWLANYSFSDLEATPLEPMVEVTSDTVGAEYFPEKYLCEWLDANFENCSAVRSFARTGVQPLARSYQELADELNLDALVMVDGGTDSLMRGDEVGLGTPAEDLTSIAAADLLDLETKLLVCLGFGVDTYHGVCHYYFLEAVAELASQGYFLGSFSLTPEMEESRLFRQAAEFVFQRMPRHPSIVVSSVLASMEGRFGDFHPTHRTRGSHLYMNPLMSLYWCFELGGVAERCLYIEDIVETQTLEEVGRAILLFQQSIERKPWQELPF